MIALRDDIEGSHVRGRCDSRCDTAGRRAHQADFINGLDVKKPFPGISKSDKQRRAAMARGDKGPGVPGSPHPDFIADEIER
jgi:hypothetical protein